MSSMRLLVKARTLLRNLFLSHRVDSDFDPEVLSHLELLVEENIRAGMMPNEAKRAARIELGGIEQVKERVREARVGNWLHCFRSGMHPRPTAEVRLERPDYSLAPY